MTRGYDTFCDTPMDLKEGEGTLALRQLNPDDRRKKYVTRYVRAFISPSPEAYEDLLWLRYQRGRLHPEPWSVRIVEELGTLPTRRVAEVPLVRT
ncbi:MAG TPA: phenylphosphate carboxylase subunit gamma [Dehalococcoidia bacterium]|nr:phenylphosphate carboxylase subunit gamma [Dehalococcoidia bacterium]HLB29838.1 phenylphosphate carboxylase subunit gamma [Dehalococcoidia bacterium]